MRNLIEPVITEQINQELIKIRTEDEMRNTIGSMVIFYKKHSEIINPPFINYKTIFLLLDIF